MVANEGIFFISSLSSAARRAHVDVEDIGAVAAVVLTEEGHSERVYDLTGPEPLNDYDVAARMTVVLGHPVRHEQVPTETVGEAMRRNGVQETTIEGPMELWAFFEFGGADSVSSRIQEILGRPARTFDDFVKDRRSAFVKRASPS